MTVVFLLVVPEGFDRIHARGAGGGVQAGQEADEDGEGDGAEAVKVSGIPSISLRLFCVFSYPYVAGCAASTERLGDLLYRPVRVDPNRA